MFSLLVDAVAWLKGVAWDFEYGFVRDFILNGPSITLFTGFTIGGYEGKSAADICALKGGAPASFWEKNQEQCDANIEKIINAWTLMLWWPIWAYVAREIIKYVWARAHAPPPPPAAVLTPARQSTRKAATEEERARANFKRRETKEKVENWPLLMLFVRTLVRVGEESPNMTLGEFFRQYHVPVKRTLLELPPVPAPPAGIDE